MNEPKPTIKLAYTKGLRSVVLDELKANPKFEVLHEGADSVYIEFHPDQLADIKRLGSVSRAYVTLADDRYNPSYIANHKSILGNLAEVVIRQADERFESFKITCAGSESPEVRDIAEYIENTYHLIEKDEADLKIHIIKILETWEAGIQITSRPLSSRQYKARNMSGAMDPTVAYAMNSLCRLENASSYLNAFSGSGTLLIEAGLSYPNLERLIGFDHDKEHLSLAIQNIKEAGLIRRAELKEADILNHPDFGTFDAITADLPFGMAISKGEDLESLYRSFIRYCEVKLNPGGTLAVYTSEYKLLEKIISASRFDIAQSIDIESTSSVNARLKTRISICRL
jgi:tRNA (guanine6-N2)-methyltransferase